MATTKPKITASDTYREPTQFGKSTVLSGQFVPFRNEGFPLELFSVVTNSPTALSCIDKAAKLIAGGGFVVSETDEMGNPALMPNQAQAADLTALLYRNRNLKGQNWRDIFVEKAKNLAWFGNGFTEVIVSNDRVTLYTLNVKDVRPVADDDFITKEYGIAKDHSGRLSLLSSVFNTDYKLPAFPIFKDMGDGTQRSVLHVKLDTPNFDYWGLPYWISGIHWAELEYRIPKFNIDKFKNGLTPSGLLQLFGNMPQDKAQDYLDQLLAHFTDTENNFKVMAQIIRNPDMKGQFVPFETTHEGFFLQLQDLAKMLVATSMQFPLSLAGTSTAGQLGSNQQLKTEFEILKSFLIEPMQRLLEERALQPLLSLVSDLQSKDYLDQIAVKLATVSPVSLASDIVPVDVLTRNEQRELLGYEPDDVQPQTVPPAPVPAPAPRGFFNKLFKR